MEYVGLTDGTVVPSSLDVTTDPNNPRCSSILKEVAYTVLVSSVDEPDTDISKNAYLKIDSITADIVIQDTNEPITAVKDEDSGLAMASVHQKFSIKFIK